MSTTTETKQPKAKKPKAPSDHKPKTDKKPKVTRGEDGVTVTLHGITVTMLHEAFDDWELLEALGELDRDNPQSISVLPGLLKRALGPEDAEKVKTVLRDPATGRIPLAAGVGFFLDLMKAVNPNG